MPDSETDNSSVPRGESARTAPPAEDEPPFVYGPNPLRLRGKDWAAAGVLLVVISTAICLAWPALEEFDPEPDYRIPYDLSSDFWMYSRWCERAASDHEVLVIGDSSIWGHYVDAKDTLTGCLNRLAGESRFANLGLSGLPFCGPDIGGFAGDCDGELLVRWTQVGALTPFFRNHSAIGSRRQEPWAFGEPYESICRRWS